MTKRQTRPTPTDDELSPWEVALLIALALLLLGVAAPWLHSVVSYGRLL